MKQLLISISCLLLFFSGSFGQAPSIKWQKTFGGNGAEFGNDFKKTFDGGFILVGSTASSNGDVVGYHYSSTGKPDIWIVKLDSSKNIIWQKCIGGIGNDRGFKILQLPDSGYVVMALTNSTDGDLTGLKTTTDTQVWLLRISKTGNIIWNKLTTGNQAYDLVEIDNRYYFVEAWNSGGSGVATIDTSGNIVYKKGFSGNLSFGTYAQKIIKTYDKGYIVAGSSTLTSIGSISSNGSSDVYLCKMDSNFNIKWQNLIGTSFNDGANDIIQTSDSGYLVGGYTLLATGSTLTGHHGSYDYCITKVDKNGQKQWSKYYGGSDEDRVIGMFRDDSNGVIVYGTTASSDGDITGFKGSTSGIIYDLWIIKTDTLGTLKWQRCFGSTDYDEAKKIIKETDSTYLFIGLAGSNDGDVITNHNMDMWFVNLTTSYYLPLQLVSFVANKSYADIQLKWNTLNEINIFNFVLERSTDSRVFMQVGNIAPNKNNSYYYFDRDVSNYEKLYYRLKIIDNDGSFNYSSIVSVDNTKSNTKNQTLYPNPANNNLVILGGNFTEIKIINILGQTVMIKQFLTTTNNQIHIDITGLTSGMYFVQCKGDKYSTTEKLIIEK